VPTLLLQPLVENSVLHGLEGQVAGGRVTVSARREGKDVVLDVVDTGVGLGAADAPASEGFGMAQTRERLATLYGTAASVELGPGPAGGARATARFPASS
jgi:LytS/YehU family sensor histidine kinase